MYTLHDMYHSIMQSALACSLAPDAEGREHYAFMLMTDWDH